MKPYLVEKPNIIPIKIIPKTKTVNINEENFCYLKQVSEQSGFSIDEIVNHIIDNVLINTRTIPTSKNTGT